MVNRLKQKQKQQQRGTAMKKFNTKKIAEILNSRMACGLGYGRKGHKFEIDGDNMITVCDFDRGSRRDSDHMCELDYDAEVQEYLATWMGSIKMIEKTCADQKYAVSVTFDMDEKGWCFINICPAPGSKVCKPKKSYDPGADSKVAPKKDTRKKITLPKQMGVIETIRTAIFAERLTRVEILEVLTSTFPERDGAKMAKTIAAQLPKRILKAGQEMEVKNNASGIKTYKMFTK